MKHLLLQKKSVKIRGKREEAAQDKTRKTR